LFFILGNNYFIGLFILKKKNIFPKKEGNHYLFPVGITHHNILPIKPSTRTTEKIATDKTHASSSTLPTLSLSKPLKDLFCCFSLKICEGNYMITIS
jgi:hypothetical protein